MHRTIILGAFAGVLAIAACTPSTGGQTTAVSTPGTSVAAVPTTAPPAATPDAEATITVLDFELDPSTVAVSGSTVSLAVTNRGPTVHNVTVRDDAGDILFATADLREGESETLVRRIDPGQYVLFCSLAGHESLGIKGTFTVSAP